MPEARNVEDMIEESLALNSVPESKRDLQRLRRPGGKSPRRFRLSRGKAMIRRPEKPETGKAWDTMSAWNLQAEAEELVRRLEPRGYERSDPAAAEDERIRENLSRAYYWQDKFLHEKAVLEMALFALKDLHRWLVEQTDRTEPGNWRHEQDE